MMVKQIVSEEPIPLVQVKEILECSPEPKEEMKYEKKRALEHAQTFAKLDPKASAALVEALLQSEKIKPDIAHRIADLLPQSRDEVRAIYAKERFHLNDQELDAIVETVKKHL